MKRNSILMGRSAESITSTINRLGNYNLTPTSHLYPSKGTKKIIDASREHTTEFNRIAQSKPAIGLIEVVLSANRSYVRHVQHHILRLSASTVSSFEDLVNKIQTEGEEQFYKFWGPRDPKKFRTLTSILTAISDLKLLYPQAKDDYELMNLWATNIDLFSYRKDLIGSISNVGIATIQHLRMTFGVNTVKPDLRVKEVLENEFNLRRLSDIDAIYVIEEMSKISEHSPLMLDQIFVNYGSGYYNRVEGSLRKKSVATSCATRQ